MVGGGVGGVMGRVACRPAGGGGEGLGWTWYVALPSARGMMIGVVGINDDRDAATGRGMRPGDEAPVPRQ